MNNFNKKSTATISNNILPVDMLETYLDASGNLNPINLKSGGSDKVIIVRKKEGLYIQTERLLFRVSGLSTENTHRLKVAVRVSYPDDNDNSYIQTLDLYRPEDREFFAENAFKDTAIKSSLIKMELKTLINVLDKERCSMLEGRLPDLSEEMTNEDRDQALDYLKDTDLLNKISKDIEALGLIGEQKNSLLLYFALTSRILPVPVSVNILSRSGAGKTFLRNTIFSLFPNESIRSYTTITNKALLYDSKNLHHKILSVDDIEGIRECFPFIRSIISDQHISILSTISDARLGQRSVQDISHEVAVSVIVSSNSLNLLDEDSKRLFLTITLDESQEQTKKIAENQILYETADKQELLPVRAEIQRIHHNMQRLLRPVRVCFPSGIKIDSPSACLHNRKDMIILISLIKSIALLHQYQRPVIDGAIFIQESDIQTAIELSRESFQIGSDELSPQGRTVLSFIKSYVSDQQKNNSPVPISEISFSRSVIRSLCGWSESYLRIIFEELSRLGYISKIKGKQGLKYSYVLLENHEHFAEHRNSFAVKIS
jgi:hypothetical protein